MAPAVGDAHVRPGRAARRRGREPARFTLAVVVVSARDVSPDATVAAELRRSTKTGRRPARRAQHACRAQAPPPRPVWGGAASSASPTRGCASSAASSRTKARAKFASARARRVYARVLIAERGPRLPRRRCLAVPRARARARRALLRRRQADRRGRRLARGARQPSAHGPVVPRERPRGTRPRAHAPPPAQADAVREPVARLGEEARRARGGVSVCG